jgi:hypothetical protein
MRLRNSNGSFKRGCATGTVASDGPAGDGWSRAEGGKRAFGQARAGLRVAVGGFWVTQRRACGGRYASPPVPVKSP